MERLLLDTARHASGNSRLFVMAASWLTRYGQKVDPNRLADLVAGELEQEHRAVLGLLLSTVHRHAGHARFAAAVAACSPAEVAMPLFEVERRNAVTWRMSERRASGLSREWNLWAPDFEPKYDAIRPASWVDAANPSFRPASRSA
ncbi:MAG TPA: hypothetical protein VF796_05770 [Humisphaera sp.]